MKISFPKARPTKIFLPFALCVAARMAQAADFTVVASFPTYTINGLSNPGLTLRRGTTYSFSINSSGHPFYIKSVQGSTTANAFTNGVTGNGAQSGTLTFSVPTNAPGTLFYDCSIHASMTGTITIIDPPVPPAPQILFLGVGSNLDVKFTGSNTFSYFPEFNTNLATTNWFALTVQTNVAANGTNDAICSMPSANPVFIRVRAQ
jgi:plastocyanin